MGGLDWRQNSRMERVERKEGKKERKIPLTGDSTLARRERKEGKERNLNDHLLRRLTVGDWTSDSAHSVEEGLGRMAKKEGSMTHAWHC